MKKCIIIAIVLLYSYATANAQNNDPEIPLTGDVINDFVPKGWKKRELANGDLNKDGFDDMVLIIQNTSPLNIKINKGLGQDTLDLNPRILIILFGAMDASYKRVLLNKQFIPAPNDEESPCLADPLDEGGLEVKKGVLKIYFQFWQSCGSWSVANRSYSFRFQHNQFELIGSDNKEYHRSGGEAVETSINFSTKKKCVITGINMFDEKESKPKSTCTDFPVEKLKTLETLGNESSISF